MPCRVLPVSLSYKSVHHNVSAYEKKTTQPNLITHELSIIDIRHPSLTIIFWPIPCKMKLGADFQNSLYHIEPLFFLKVVMLGIMNEYCF